MSQINIVYKKAYFKSIGQDNESKKRKREKASKFIDEWIEEQEKSQRYEREIDKGKREWVSTSTKIHQEVEAAVHRKASRGGSFCDEEIHREIKEESERRIKEELGSQEGYATEYADESFVPHIPLSLILSLRNVLKYNS